MRHLLWIDSYMLTGHWSFIITVSALERGEDDAEGAADPVATLDVPQLPSSRPDSSSSPQPLQHELTQIEQDAEREKEDAVEGRCAQQLRFSRLLDSLLEPQFV